MEKKLKKLQSLLEQHRRAALDTMVFIYHFEEYHAYLPLTRQIFNTIERKEIAAVTSIITLAEILVEPLNRENFEAVENYKLILNTFPNLTLLGLDQNISVLASSLTSKYKIRLPDALQISAGLSSDASLFITNDKSLKKITEIEVLSLNDL